MIMETFTLPLCVLNEKENNFWGECNRELSKVRQTGKAFNVSCVFGASERLVTSPPFFFSSLGGWWVCACGIY